MMHCSIVALCASFMQILSVISWHGGDLGWGWVGTRVGEGVMERWGSRRETLDLAPLQSSWFLIHNICISILLWFLWYSAGVARRTDHKWFSTYKQISKTFNIYSHCNTTAKDWTGDEFQRKPQAQQKRQDNKRARKVLPEVALTVSCKWIR